MGKLSNGDSMLCLARYSLACLLFSSMVQVIFGSSAGAGTRSFPIAFEANRGQAPARYSYVFHRDGMEAQFSSKGVDFVLADSTDRRRTVHMSFVGGHAEPRAENALGAMPTTSSEAILRDGSTMFHSIPCSTMEISIQEYR